MYSILFIFLLLPLSVFPMLSKIRTFIKGPSKVERFLNNPRDIKLLKELLEEKYMNLIEESEDNIDTKRIIASMSLLHLFIMTVDIFASNKNLKFSTTIDELYLYNTTSKDQLICYLLNDLHYLASIVAPDHKIFNKKIKYNAKPIFACETSGGISSTLKLPANIEIIREAKFLVFDKYLMEGESKFKNLLSNPSNVQIFKKLVHEFGNESYLILMTKHLIKAEGGPYLSNIYEDYFTSTVITKWRAKLFIEYIIFNEWNNNFIEQNYQFCDTNFIIKWQIMSVYWLGENFIKSSFLNLQRPNDNEMKEEMLRNFLFIEEYAIAQPKIPSFLQTLKYCAELGLEFINSNTEYNYNYYLKSSEINDDNKLGIFIDSCIDIELKEKGRKVYRVEEQQNMHLEKLITLFLQHDLTALKNAIANDQTDSLKNLTNLNFKSFNNKIKKIKTKEDYANFKKIIRELTLSHAPKAIKQRDVMTSTSESHEIEEIVKHEEEEEEKYYDPIETTQVIQYEPKFEPVIGFGYQEQSNISKGQKSKKKKLKGKKKQFSDLNINEEGEYYNIQMENKSFIEEWEIIANLQDFITKGDSRLVWATSINRDKKRNINLTLKATEDYLTNLYFIHLNHIEKIKNNNELNIIDEEKLFLNIFVLVKNIEEKIISKGLIIKTNFINIDIKENIKEKLKQVDESWLKFKKTFLSEINNENKLEYYNLLLNNLINIHSILVKLPHSFWDINNIYERFNDFESSTTYQNGYSEEINDLHFKKVEISTKYNRILREDFKNFENFIDKEGIIKKTFFENISTLLNKQIFDEFITSIEKYKILILQQELDDSIQNCVASLSSSTSYNECLSPIYYEISQYSINSQNIYANQKLLNYLSNINNEYLIERRNKAKNWIYMIVEDWVKIVYHEYSGLSMIVGGSNLIDAELDDSDLDIYFILPMKYLGIQQILNCGLCQNNIHQNLGICPQHDFLFGNNEHSFVVYLENIIINMRILNQWMIYHSIKKGHKHIYLIGIAYSNECFKRSSTSN
ncbi:NTP_transf_2 domain-containing protein [Meloidogyne graminicola]|uniref:NTP_transf_2 domain-containing protein n=1 Tax=Meloidogyne graminicola TaxID=189291 RepID=A0A8S9ZTA2_9BILA|nr:NTP_transf_2 domain-containing protein [Meloidogyne graminicola]